MKQSTFFSLEHHLSHSQLRETEMDLMMTVATCQSNFAIFWIESIRAGLFGRMSL